MNVAASPQRIYYIRIIGAVVGSLSISCVPITLANFAGSTGNGLPASIVM